MKVGLATLLVLGGLLAAKPASALPLVVTDLQVAGDGLVTLDPSSGLEWLDLTQTASLSYNTVSGQFGAGGLFEGWRYATDVEFATLLSNAGIPDSFPNQTATVSTNALSLLRDYLGYLNSPNEYYLYFQALLNGANNTSTLATRGLVQVFQTDVYAGSPNVYARANWDTFDKTSTHWGVGSLLVRNQAASVPDAPSAALLLLMASGLIGLGRNYLRRRN